MRRLARAWHWLGDAVEASLLGQREDHWSADPETLPTPEKPKHRKDSDDGQADT